jgi:hypothetical protein
MGGKGQESTLEGLHWLKHNTFAGKISMQNFHWTTNRHLNNEGQEWKTGHTNGRSHIREEG